MVLFQVKDSLGKIFPKLNSCAQASVTYHDIFDYPLTEGELIKWEAGKDFVGSKKTKTKVLFDNGFYFLSGREGLIHKRLLRERNYIRKLTIARKAGKICNVIPGIVGVFVTGAVAMNNADDKADVDLMVVSKGGFLWTTRALVVTLFRLIGFPVRKFGDSDEKDKLCFNLWLDEEALSWPAKKRNIYSAHEIAQVQPIVNKNNIYERFLYANRWIKTYWPNSVRIVKPKRRSKYKINNILFLGEVVARESQRLYMRRKITKEIIGKNRAVFHPNDMTSLVLAKFEKGLTEA
jgi:predicted nucleotidyltransferase